MKKVILSIALFTGLAAVSNIEATTVSNNKAAIEAVLQNDGFVDVKFEELNEKVQASVKALIQEYDLNAIQFNAETQVTKVDATKKADQSKKVFFFDAEGNEIKTEAAPEQKTEEKTEQQIPSPEMLDTLQNDGFVDVKFEELNEKVQAAIRVIDEAYDLNAIQLDAEKKITKVKATKKDDQSKKTFYLDNEGVQITLEQAPQQTEEEKVEEQK